MTRLLTTKELADHVGCSTKTVQRWAQARKIRHHRISGRYYFSESVLEELESTPMAPFRTRRRDPKVSKADDMELLEAMADAMPQQARAIMPQKPEAVTEPSEDPVEKVEARHRLALETYFKTQIKQAAGPRTRGRLERDRDKARQKLEQWFIDERISQDPPEENMPC
jgi:excisionase family DNA binding protein